MTSDKNREDFGYAPLNNPFKGSHFHHFHYRPLAGGVDKSLGIHIPKELHTAIRHNHLTGQRMHEMNLAALQWYMIYTTEELNPVATGLYQHYKNMTRSQIQEEQNKLWKENLDTEPPKIDFAYLRHYGFFHKVLEINARRNEPETAPVAEFIKECCEIGETPLTYDSENKLYKSYVDYANNNNYKPLTVLLFRRAVAGLGYEMERVNSTQAFLAYIYVGLRIKEQ